MNPCCRKRQLVTSNHNSRRNNTNNGNAEWYVSRNIVYNNTNESRTT